MTYFHESYLAGHGFDITTPGLKTDYRSANCATRPVEYACMYAFMCACLHVRVCMRATDGRDGQRMERWVDLYVYVRKFTCARPYLRVCDPVCEDGMIDARSDGRTDGWMN